MMERRSRKKRFVALGTLGAEKIGLSSRRTEELRLREAWRRCAGRRLAERAAVVGLRRGRLTLRMIDGDPVWRRTIEDLAPDLAAAIADRCTALRMHSVVVIGQDGVVGAAQPLGVAPAAPQRTFGARQAGGVEVHGWPPERLERLMARYLDRSSDSDG